ncbi:MAG: DNA repair protein RecO [Bacteroidales bacterium]|jgi:DNA repair protein RecO (recombination protein O)|nr:DNA repair protein RecO [Bacteroidales bacterium]
MYIRTRGIVLNHLKYGETSLIVRVFTEHSGLQSFIVKGSRSPKNKGKISLFQPLSLIEIDFPEHTKSDLLIFKDARTLHHYSSISSTIEKHSIFVFLSEVLNKILCFSQAENELFEFVYNSLIALDNATAPCNNFHLIFLRDLTDYLGIRPIEKQSLNNLNAILEYYGQHIPNFLPVKSHLVLHEVLR